MFPCLAQPTTPPRRFGQPLAYHLCLQTGLLGPVLPHLGSGSAAGFPPLDDRLLLLGLVVSSFPQTGRFQLTTAWVGSGGWTTHCLGPELEQIRGWPNQHRTTATPDGVYSTLYGTAAKVRGCGIKLLMDCLGSHLRQGCSVATLAWFPEPSKHGAPASCSPRHPGGWVSRAELVRALPARHHLG